MRQGKRELTFITVAVLMVVLLIVIVAESLWFLIPRLNAVVSGGGEAQPPILFQIDAFKKLNLQ